MNKTLKVRSLSQKSYSSVEWEQLNPVLLKGEFGYDTDKDDFKIGDGATVWNSLPFYNSKNVLSRVVLEDPVIGRVRCLSYGTNDLDGVECTVVNDDDQYEKMNLLEALVFNIVGLFYPERVYGFPFGYDGDFNGVHLVLEGLVNASKVELIGNDKQLLIKAIGYMCNADFDPNADIENWDDFKNNNFIDLDNYVAITTYLMSDGSTPIEGYGIPFSIIPELIFRMPLSGGGGGGGGYGNTGLGEAIKKTGVTFLEDDGLEFKADYVYTGITDPATITVGEMPLFAYILFNAMGGDFQDAVSVEPVSFDFSTIDCAVTRLYAEIDGVEYSLPELMGVDSKFSFRPFFNSGTRVVVAMVVDSDLGQVEIIIKNDGNAEGRTILEYQPVSSGGGVSISEEQVYIDSSEWYEINGKYEVIKYINDLDYDSMVWYSADLNSLEAFAEAGVVMTEQSSGQVTFGCKEKPQNQIAVIVRWAK